MYKSFLEAKSPALWRKIDRLDPRLEATVTFAGVSCRVLNMETSCTCPTLTGILLPVTLLWHVSYDQIHPCIELKLINPGFSPRSACLTLSFSRVRNCLIDKQCQDLLAQEISALLFWVSFLLAWPQGVIYIPSFSLPSIQNSFPMEDETLNENFLMFKMLWCLINRWLLVGRLADWHPEHISL